MEDQTRENHIVRGVCEASEGNSETCRGAVVYILHCTVYVGEYPTYSLIKPKN